MMDAEDYASSARAEALCGKILKVIRDNYGGGALDMSKVTDLEM
jgi:hypothetical protein